jgi:alkylhydroperoxidase family enzyme
MLDFAVRLTTEAYQTTPEDLERLRAAGFNDVGILQITLIASWFNYINRVADALGVGKPVSNDQSVANNSSQLDTTSS